MLSRSAQVPELQGVTRAETPMTDLTRSDISTADFQQNESQPAHNINSVSPCAGMAHQVNEVVSYDQRTPNHLPSTSRSQEEFNRSSDVDERTSLQSTREELADQTIRDEEINLESITAVMKETSKRKDWEKRVCLQCMNAKHLKKHLEINKKEYKGSAGAFACRQGGCPRWTSLVWKSNFIRLDDCTHSENLANCNNAISLPAGSASMPAKNMPTRRDRLRRQAKSRQSQREVSKGSKQQPPPLRTATGKFATRSEQQSKTNVTKKAERLTKSAASQHQQGGAIEPQRQPRVPPGVVTTNGNVPQGFESFNLDILNTYQGKHIEQELVDNCWTRIATQISEFDLYIRGIPYNEDIRASLRFLDNTTPLSDLQEVRDDFKSPQEYHNLPALLWLLKTMFKVPIYKSLKSVIGDQVRKLRFSFVLRATLAYIIHLKVFSEPERKSEWEEIEKHAIALCGEQQGAALIQYLRLGEHQSDHFRETLRDRTTTFARSFYNTLLPLWAERGSWCRDQQKLLGLLTRLTHDCLSLAADLHAREGTFNFMWPAYGDPFDADLYSVDASQHEAVAAMSEEVVGRQVIAFTLMPAVQRVLSYREEALRYARGVVLLREPYAE